MAQELSPDDKGSASLTLGGIIPATRENFPDPRFQPRIHLETTFYHIYGIDPSPYQFWVTGDGIGTKPELAERLTDTQRRLGKTQDYSAFQTLAFDVLAMIKGDEDRWGRFLLGVVDIVDTNTADFEMIKAITLGVKQACDEGQFALLNGETAELRNRVGGYGKSRLNWNAFGISLVVPNKLILGKDLQPGQPIVALREKSIRSNGLTPARFVLENSFLLENGYHNYAEHLFRIKHKHIDNKLTRSLRLSNFFKKTLDSSFNTASKHLNVDLHEIRQVPWHELYPDITKELLRPSALYGGLMYQAQGGVDGPKEIDIVAAAHISGGGIPEKVKRMVEPKGLGVHIESVFPIPKGIQMILDLNKSTDERFGFGRITDLEACQTWNLGLGFLMVVRTQAEADNLIKMAQQLGIEADIAGEILDRPEVDYRGHIWKYSKNPAP